MCIVPGCGVGHDEEKEKAKESACFFSSSFTSSFVVGAAAGAAATAGAAAASGAAGASRYSSRWGKYLLFYVLTILNPLLSFHIIRDCAVGGSVLAFSRGKCVVFRAREETGRRQRGRRRRTKTARQHPTRWSGEVDGNMVGYYHLSLLTLYKNRKLKISLAIFLQCVVFVLEAQ